MHYAPPSKISGFSGYIDFFWVSYLIFVKVSTNLDLRVKYALHCTTSSAKLLNAWNIKLVVINLEGCTGFWKRIFKSVQKTTICGISMICSSNLFWIRLKRFFISCTVNDNFNNTPFIIITILFYIDRAPWDICILRSQVVYRCIQLVFPVHNTLFAKQVYIQVFLGLNLDRIPYPDRVVGALPFSSKVWTSSLEKTGPSITSTTLDFSFQNFRLKDTWPSGLWPGSDIWYFGWIFIGWKGWIVRRRENGAAPRWQENSDALLIAAQASTEVHLRWRCWILKVKYTIMDI